MSAGMVFLDSDFVLKKHVRGQTSFLRFSMFNRGLHAGLSCPSVDGSWGGILDRVAGLTRFGEV